VVTADPGAVVVAFGSADLLARALAPLTGLRVVVVDNSSDKLVRGACSAAGALYVDPGANLGFAAGVNLGIRTLWGAGRCDVLLLNPDAVVTTATVTALHHELHRAPRTAAVSPRLVGGDGPQRVMWPWPTPGRMWREALGLLGSSRDDADWLVGAVLLLSADAYDEVGPFDELFFLYAEETDWQRRAVLAGWSVRLVADVAAEHAGAGTSADGRRREDLFHAGTETYVRKWHGRTGWTSYRAASVVSALLRSPRPGEAGARARRRAYVFFRGPRRVARLDA
jgi:GT2 family glycosyltransferase